MPDANSLVALMKKAAKEERDTSKPCDVLFGTVTSVSPLQITTEQQLPLGVAQLVLTRNVTNHSTTVTVSWSTDKKGGGSGEAAYESHAHGISGTKKITINNGLAVGEKVVLVRQDGGQKFLVLDRVVALS